MLVIQVSSLFGDVVRSLIFLKGVGLWFYILIYSDCKKLINQAVQLHVDMVFHQLFRDCRNSTHQGLCVRIAAATITMLTRTKGNRVLGL